jgi:hypothetical protein
MGGPGIGETKNAHAYNVFIGKSERNIPLGRHTNKLENNIKVYILWDRI